MPTSSAVEAYAAEARAEFFNELAAATNLSARRFTGTPGTPMVSANLTAAELYLVSRLHVVANVESDPATRPAGAGYCQNDYSWVGTVEGPGTGYDGSGQTVCILEGDHPSDYTYLNSAGTYSNPNSSPGVHSEFVATMISNSYPGGPSGVAPGAETYFADYGGLSNMGPAVYNGCVLNDYPIWDASVYGSDFDARYFDYWATAAVSPYPYPFVAVAAAIHGHARRMATR